MSLIGVMGAILVILAWRNLLDGDFARVEPVSDRQLEVLVYGASSELYSYSEAAQTEPHQIFGGRERGLSFTEEMAFYSMMRFLSSQASSSRPSLIFSLQDTDTTSSHPLSWAGRHGGQCRTPLIRLISHRVVPESPAVEGLLGDSSLVCACANPCYSSRAREKGAVLLILPFSLSLTLSHAIFASISLLFVFCCAHPVPFNILCYSSFTGSKQTVIALVSRQASLTTRREWSICPISSTFNAFCRKASKIEDNYPGCRFLRRSIGVETGQIYTKRTLGREIMDARHA
ncbi:hypothetical protein LB504_009491 [Fusarium proliferatum]|nr:hypothetical protein LB504_009491 [Fusarium proliferatum]